MFCFFLKIKSDYICTATKKIRDQSLYQNHIFVFLLVTCFSRLVSHYVTTPSVMMRTPSQSPLRLNRRDGSAMAVRGQTHLVPSHLATESEAVSVGGLLSWRCIWFCFRLVEKKNVCVCVCVCVCVYVYIVESTVESIGK